MENKDIFNYTKLVAYQRAKELVGFVYRIQKGFPKEEQYALCDQLRRASISITSNIAEGTNRCTFPDKIHFLEMAYSSMMEVHSQMDIACQLGYISNETLNDVEEMIISVAKPLSGLRSSFQEKLNKKRP